MVNNRRSELEIIGKILTLSAEGAKPTEILYKGYLSYTQYKKYLPFLVEKDIISEKRIESDNGCSKIYKITNKGKEFLKDINKTLSYFK